MSKCCSKNKQTIVGAALIPTTTTLTITTPNPFLYKLTVVVRATQPTPFHPVGYIRFFQGSRTFTTTDASTTAPGFTEYFRNISVDSLLPNVPVTAIFTGDEVFSTSESAPVTPPPI